jgi:hypothetical protein
MPLGQNAEIIERCVIWQIVSEPEASQFHLWPAEMPAHIWAAAANTG